ncbi:MAG: tRNA-dihydrouridine synthase [Burkholderiales bacterium]|nr:tRNA-dihydrouridine synthase [Burkholderiales bacterium]
MTILLAPMEGPLDFALRDILTRVGGIDRCVSEFIRITDTLLPARAFKRIVPELAHGSRTPSGVPVRGQLLGSDPVCMAENAAKLAELGSAGIDLNFGCPAKVVNRHGGGAALLQDPEHVERIVAAVRAAVPRPIPVSAKMRLGFHDDTLAEACAQAIEAGGAEELVIHARTKAHGYRPPAYWDRIADIRAHVRVPVIANGEIWSVADAHRCRDVTGCEMLMIGRGAVANPGLGQAIAGEQAVITWAEVIPLLHGFWQLICANVVPKHRAGRMKQWLNYLRRTYPEAEDAYMAVRIVNDSRQIESWLNSLSPEFRTDAARLPGTCSSDAHCGVWPAEAIQSPS